MPTDDKEDFQMRIDASLKTQMKAQAKAESRSLASMVTHALRVYLQRLQAEPM
jgi:predicted HicB family RNase H-like nuclease